MIFLLFNYIILAISSSIDALGIGISYGVRNTKIYLKIKVLLFFVSLIITGTSIVIGKTIMLFIPIHITNLLGSLIIIFIGTFILFQNILKNKLEANNNSKIFKEKSFFLKSLGITIKIIREPIYSDLNKSNSIELNEAIYLALALSLDSFSIAISSVVAGFASYSFAIFNSIFQFIFLSLGLFLGKKLIKIKHVPDNTWSIISGILLIFIGILKLF